MSNKNFMSYDDANNIFSSYAGETKKRLLVSSTMPAASLDFLDTQRLYVGDTTDTYTKGGIYECNVVEGSDPIEYVWVLISVAEVDLSDYKTTFVGTSAEWNALSAEDKAKYILVNLTDDKESLGSEVVDAVTDGVLNPVTSNAVFDKFNFKTLCNKVAASTYTNLPNDFNEIEVCVYALDNNNIYQGVDSIRLSKVYIDSLATGVTECMELNSVYQGSAIFWGNSVNVQIRNTSGTFSIKVNELESYGGSTVANNTSKAYYSIYYR